MKVQGQIARGMCEVECNNASLFVASIGDSCHVEGLTGGIVHAAKQNERNRFAFTIDQRFDVFIAHARFAGTGSEFEQRRLQDRIRENEFAISRRTDPKEMLHARSEFCADVFVGR